MSGGPLSGDTFQGGGVIVPGCFLKGIFQEGFFGSIFRGARNILLRGEFSRGRGKRLEFDNPGTFETS